MRIVTKAGTEETQVPVPPTHICKYVPGPGAALKNNFKSYGDAWLREGKWRKGGREKGSNCTVGEVWENV